MHQQAYDEAYKAAIVQRVLDGEAPYAIERIPGNPQAATIRKWVKAAQGASQKREIIQKHIAKPKVGFAPVAPSNAPVVMFLDIETLPNMGLFFDTYSDRAIALDFILKPKAVCSIAWKFSDEAEPTALSVTTPYDDGGILADFLPHFERADYVVWHYGEGFDRKFLDGRLFANGLPALPPVASIDTYKLARQKFGRTLNSNKLDHLGEILGVGRKNKTDASLWVRCAKGEEAALREMAEYNVQDVVLLEAVYNKLAPNVQSQMNRNIMHDDAVCRCKSCGSENIELKGFELKPSTLRHRYQCKDCGAWSTFPRKKK